MINWRVLAILFCLCFGLGALAQYLVPSLDVFTTQSAATAAANTVVASPAIAPAPTTPTPVQHAVAAPVIEVPAPVAAPVVATVAPPARGTAERPPARGTAEQPPARDTTEQPPARGTAEQPPARDTTEQPPARGTTERPPARGTAESRAVTPVAGVVQPVLQPAVMSVPPQATQAPMPARPAAHSRPEVNPHNRDRLNREFVRNCMDNTLAALHRNGVSVPRPRVDVLCRCYAHHRLEVMQASLERSVALDAMTNAVGVINARGPVPRVGYLYLTEFAVAERHCPWMRGASMAPEQSTRDPAPPAQAPRAAPRRAADPHEAPRMQPVRVSAPQRQ